MWERGRGRERRKKDEEIERGGEEPERREADREKERGECSLRKREETFYSSTLLVWLGCQSNIKSRKVNINKHNYMNW